MKVNYGYIPPVRKPEDYVFGRSRLPTTAILPSGNYRPYVPRYEPQILKDGKDTCGCTVWGTENGYEVILRLLTGKEWNLSERFLYILLKLRPPGTDPVRAAQALRDHGIVENDVLPTLDTWDEFIRPDPLPKHLTDLAKKFGYEFSYEYVWEGDIPIEEKVKKITAALKCSPLGVSLFAWEQDENGLYYRVPGERDTHWCLLIAEEPGYYIILDSYDQSEKLVRKDMDFGVCIRYHVEKKMSTAPKKSFWGFLVELLRNFIS